MYQKISGIDRDMFVLGIRGLLSKQRLGDSFSSFEASLIVALTDMFLSMEVRISDVCLYFTMQKNQAEEMRRMRWGQLL